MTGKRSQDARGPIRVLIVEDSPVVRALLEAIIAGDPRLQLVGSLGSGEEALRQLPKLRPDVISMDVRLPGLDGLETARRIMQEHPTPIVVVTSHRSQAEMIDGFDALKAGALSVFDKPTGPMHPDFERQSRALCTQLVIMSQIKVIRLRPRRVQVVAPPVRRCKPTGRYELLGIVASTGGPKASSLLFNALGADFPLPVLLVQHITASFLNGFVEWLNTISPLPAQLATDGELPLPGRIYLPPADRHLVLRQGRLRFLDDPPVSYQRPSGTVLLESMAELGPRAIGVILTGMGDDGAAGLLRLRQAGGYTLAESEATAVVYGMPAVAVKLDAACEVLPIHEIGPRLNAML